MTKLLIIGTVLFILTGCNNSDDLTNDTRHTDNPAERKIKNLFANWQSQQIKLGRFLPADSCNPQWISTHTVQQSIDNGFPTDSTEYLFSFADLNNDGKLDGLAAFTPDQCDGGNASMWTQWQVFLISNKDHYFITDTLLVDNFASTEFDSLGFYWLDSITANRIHGTYIQFADTDGHCCPSTNRPVTFSFLDKKLISISDNIKRE